MEVEGGKYLTFVLGQEDYGIPIHKVKEIIGMMEITFIPKTPKFIKGVINLRGKIIPIMDLRLKFDMEEKEYTERTCIIVAEIQLDKMKKQIGMVVDAVSEVVNIQSAEIELPPEYGSYENVEFLTGVGKVREKVILLLDIERILDCDELEVLNKIKLEGSKC